MNSQHISCPIQGERFSLNLYSQLLSTCSVPASVLPGLIRASAVISIHQ